MLGCYVHTAPDEISTVENSCIKVLIVRKSGRLGRKYSDFLMNLK